MRIFWLAALATAWSTLLIPLAHAAEEVSTHAESTSSLRHSLRQSLRWTPEAALSLPQPIQVGAQAQCLEDSTFCSRNLRFYLDAGYFRYPPAGGNKALSIFSIEFGNRLFPFSPSSSGSPGATENSLSKPGGIFFGLGLGFRKIGFSSTDISAFKVNDETLVTEATLKLNTLYLAPSVGWEYSLSKNWVAATELGVQISLYGNGSAYLENNTTGENSDNSSLLKIQSGKALDRVAGLLLPRLTLFRLTWL